MSRRGTLGMLALVLLAFLVTLWFYPRLPDPMATHWNARGEVDGYSSRFWGAFLLPLLLLGLAVLFYLIPRIDPLRENYPRFRTYYEAFILIFMLYMIAVHLWVLLWNMGVHLGVNLFVPLGMGLLFVFIGFLLERVEPNWFVGIRTPWTLSSERVWRQTHRVGGQVFKVMGVVVMVSAFLPSVYTVWVILAVVLAGALGLVIYSYVLYERERKAGS